MLLLPIRPGIGGMDLIVGVEKITPGYLFLRFSPSSRFQYTPIVPVRVSLCYWLKTNLTGPMKLGRNEETDTGLFFTTARLVLIFIGHTHIYIPLA